MSSVLIGINWFRPDQWPEVQRVMEDKQDETYAQWLAHAHDLEAKLKMEGFDVLRRPMDLDEFQIWCLQHGRKRDAAARSAYIVEKIAK